MVLNKIKIGTSCVEGLATSERKWETETSVSRIRGSGSQFGGVSQRIGKLSPPALRSFVLGIWTGIRDSVYVAPGCSAR